MLITFDSFYSDVPNNRAMLHINCLSVCECECIYIFIDFIFWYIPRNKETLGIENQYRDLVSFIYTTPCDICILNICYDYGDIYGIF